MCVRYLKSRNHDLLKELKELDGIIEQRRRAVRHQLVFSSSSIRFGSVQLPHLNYLPEVDKNKQTDRQIADKDIVIVI